MKFMNLPDEYCGDDSEFVILPVEYEKSPTYGKGASKGSLAILKASKHLEYYDEQFDCEPYELGIKVLPAVKSIDINLPDKGFPIILGGDHAVTIGAIKAIEKKHDKFSVIILDAHPDFRYSWNGSQQNHACVARRAVASHKVGLVGVRSMDKDVSEAIAANDDVHIIKAYDYNPQKLKKLLSKLDEKVYISIDVDVFDPSFIRNTGTPEPGGFFWDRVIDVLKTVFDDKKVIGADIVEFAPITNYEAEAFALSKLCYKLIALQLRAQQ
jgi:agmatinase